MVSRVLSSMSNIRHVKGEDMETKDKPSLKQ